MRINGRWNVCDDGGLRPVVQGELLAADGTWEIALFLVDTGADRTVLSADVLEALQLPQHESEDQLGGIGGLTDPVVVDTAIRLSLENHRKAQFRGSYAGVRDGQALEMSVLGRDILNLFAVIVDRPGDVVCLVAQQHRYTISGT